MALLLVGGTAPVLAQSTTANAAPTAADAPASIIPIQIRSSGVALDGDLLAGGSGPRPTVVYLHGYPGEAGPGEIPRELRDAGVNVLYINDRGS